MKYEQKFSIIKKLDFFFFSRINLLSFFLLLVIFPSRNIFDRNFKKKIISHPSIKLFFDQTYNFCKIKNEIRISNSNEVEISKKIGQKKKIISRKKENKLLRIIDLNFCISYSHFIFSKKNKKGSFSVISFSHILKNFIGLNYFLKYKKNKISKVHFFSKKLDFFFTKKNQAFKKIFKYPSFFFELNRFVFFLGKTNKNGKLFKILNLDLSFGIDLVFKKKNNFYKKKKTFFDSFSKKKKLERKLFLFFGKYLLIFLKNKIFKKPDSSTLVFSNSSKYKKKSYFSSHPFSLIYGLKNWTKINTFSIKKIIIYKGSLKKQIRHEAIGFFLEKIHCFLNSYSLKISIIILLKMLSFQKKFLKIKVLNFLYQIIFRSKIKKKILKDPKIKNFTQPTFFAFLFSLNILSILNFLNLKNSINDDREKDSKKISMKCFTFFKICSKVPFFFFLKKKNKNSKTNENFRNGKENVIFKCKACIFCFFKILLTNLIFFLSSKTNFEIFLKTLKIWFFRPFSLSLSFKEIIYRLDFEILEKKQTNKYFLKKKFLKISFGCIKKIFKSSRKEYVSFYIFLKKLCFSYDFYPFIFFLLESSFWTNFFFFKTLSNKKFYSEKNIFFFNINQTITLRKHNKEISNFYIFKSKKKKIKKKKKICFLILFLEKNINLGPNRPHYSLVPNLISFLMREIQNFLFSKFLIFFFVKVISGHFSREIKINIIRLYHWKLITGSFSCNLTNFFYFSENKSCIFDQKFRQCFFFYYKNLQNLIDFNIEQNSINFLLYGVYFNQYLVYEKIFVFVELFVHKNDKKLPNFGITEMLLFLIEKTERLFKKKKFKWKLKNILFHQKIINFYAVFSIYLGCYNLKEIFFKIIEIYYNENGFLFLDSELIATINLIIYKKNFNPMFLSSKKKNFEIMKKNLVFKKISFNSSFYRDGLKTKIFISWIKNIILLKFRSYFFKFSAFYTKKKIKKKPFKNVDRSEIPFFLYQNLETRALKILGLFFFKKKNKHFL